MSGLPEVTICTMYCNYCSDRTPGTLVESELAGRGGAPDFVCANCDRQTFDREATRQKHAYLAGAKFDLKGVH